MIAALLTSGGVLVLARETPPAFGHSCSLAADGPTAQTPIRHLFVIIKENHAFENYFGALPGVLGNPPSGSFPTAFGSNSTVRPFAVVGANTSDLPHDHASEVVDEDNGRNDLFVAQAAASGAPDPRAAVGYYNASQLPQYYAYAHAYALGDQFFSGYLGPTAPNRDFDLAATTDGQTSDSQPPLGTLQAPTILNQLTSAGVPWAYDYTGSRANITPLEFHDVGSNACEEQAVSPFSAFLPQIGSADPPAVVFIDPSHDPAAGNRPEGFSEHPPDNVTLGADWTTAVVNSVFSSPLGPSSAVLLFYDEAGGYWDPVTPPVIDGSPDGFRVPFLAISDYTPEGLVVNESLDPAAVLSFIDWNWGLAPLNSRVAASPGLGSFFDFGRTPRGPLLLPTPLNLTSLGNSSGMPGAMGRSSGLATSAAASERSGGHFAPSVGDRASVGGLRVGTSASSGTRVRSPDGRFIVRTASSPRERAGRCQSLGVRRHGANCPSGTAQRPGRPFVPAGP